MTSTQARGLVRTARIDLPWPDRRLSPNARVHWSAKASATKKARVDAAWLAREAGLQAMTADAIKATIIFSPKTARAYDLDNALASLKPAIDGIAAVVGVDDSRWDFELCRGIPTKGGRVKIVLEAR
jgi:crossover junction endodeoxyribonuclease RusA